MFRQFRGMIIAIQVAYCFLCDREEHMVAVSKQRLAGVIRARGWKKIDGVWVCSKHVNPQAEVRVMLDKLGQEAAEIIDTVLSGHNG